ncbi:hypothetical protein GP486_004767 [Trichoglossum hirsutum]|uniref:Exonuclease domain-containing protein n=1 Tax=Trichoglossum hirsutum TaxID=265104 RepID=A0A9P8RNH9_9PEZI|nr:hypothetical protein GP486_004767 [Trichoglossum hirsutum]
MGRSKAKRKRAEVQARLSQAVQRQVAAPLPLLQDLDLPTFNLTSSNGLEVSQSNNEGGEIDKADASSDSGEWQTVSSKRPPKKQKLSSKDSKNYPHIGPAKQLKLHNKIRINDLQALVLYLLADGTAPQWVAVRHYNQVRKVVVVMVPGLERGMFDGSIALSEVHPTENPSVEGSEAVEECAAVGDRGKIDRVEEVGLGNHGKLVMESHLTVDVNDNKEKFYSSPDSYFPVALSESILPKPLKPLAGIFPHLWPVFTPGDDKYTRINSPIHSMLTSPLPKTKEEKKAKGGMQPDAKNWVNKRTPITEFITTLEELRENEYVLHPALLMSAEEKAAEGNRRRLARESTDDGWVDSRVENLEDGEPNPEAIEDGSITKGRDVLAMDCEMCQTEGGQLDLTRISIVKWDGEVVLDELVKPEKVVVDYLTPYSGISKDMLDPITTTLSDIQSRLLEIFHPKSILIGHSLNSDLGALKMTHPFIIDTSILYQHPRGPPLKSSLKFLAQKYLGREIQKGHGGKGHDSIEDANACLDLVKQKCEKGPKWGTSEALGESIFKRLGRSHRPANHGAYAGSSTERRGGVVDWGKPERAFGAHAAVCIGCKNDEEVVEGVKVAVNGDTDGKLVRGGGVDFIWARLRELEALRGWWNDGRNSADAELIARAAAAAAAVHNGADPVPTLDGGITITSEVLASAVTKTVNHIAAIYNSLPLCTAMIVYTGTGDPREMSRLQALQQQFRKEYRIKNWDELSVKWTDVEEQALKRAVQIARDGLGFVVVK